MIHGGGLCVLSTLSPLTIPYFRDLSHLARIADVVSERKKKYPDRDKRVASSQRKSRIYGSIV